MILWRDINKTEVKRMSEMNNRKHGGRPKGSTKQNIVLLDYINYIVRKKTDTSYRHVAYCGSLEGALKLVYDQMLLDTVNRRNNYGARFNDLKNVILKIKNDISRLLDITPILKNEINKGEIENGRY